MTSYDELDRLSSQELHDRAWRRARHHVDVKFFWDLLKVMPAAEVAEGQTNEAMNDIEHPSGQVVEALEKIRVSWMRCGRSTSSTWPSTRTPDRRS